MRLIVLAIVGMMIVFGVYGVVSPPGLQHFVKRWQSSSGLWLAALLRLILGVSLWFAAQSSGAPLVLQTLAVVAIAAGLLLPLMGFARYEALLDWWQRQSAVYVRIWCLAAILFGAFIAWAVTV